MFGKYLAFYRIFMGISPVVMANSLGITEEVLYQIESGSIKVDNNIIIRFIDLFGEKISEEENFFLQTITNEIDECNLKNEDYIEDSVNKSSDLDSVDISKFLVDFRNRLYLDQYEMAERIEISAPTLCRFETGNFKRFPLYVIDKIEKVFDDILTDEEKMHLNYLKEKNSNIDLSKVKNLYGLTFINIRLNHNLSLSKVANDLGVTKQYLSLLELGKQKIPSSMLNKMASYYSKYMTDIEREKLMDYANSIMLSSKVSNLIISNELEEILNDFSNLKLEKKEIKSIFTEALSKAKTLEKRDS